MNTDLAAIAAQGWRVEETTDRRGLPYYRATRGGYTRGAYRPASLREDCEAAPMVITPYYDHGGITIYHGDCREVLPHISADVLVTDPPYGIGHSSGWTNDLYGNIANEYGDGSIANDTTTEARDWVLQQWGARPALVFGSWKAPRPQNVRALLIWDKGEASGMGDLSIPWKPSHEEIYVLGHGFHGPRTTGVLQAYVPARISFGRLHPNEKPVSLLRGLLLKCPSGVILDPFMGSGSTLRAAKDAGRRAIGIEIDGRYCEIAARRLSQEVLDLEAA